MPHGVYLLFFCYFATKRLSPIHKSKEQYNLLKLLYFTQKAFFTHRTSNKSCAISRM
jgi:hypothetical protein